MHRFAFRDGVPYYDGPAPSAAEMMDENRPLPRLALYALGWTDAQIDAVGAVESDATPRGLFER